MKINDNGRNFVCEDCEKTFKTKDNDLHLKMHSNVRDFECNKCGGAFQIINTIINHIETFDFELWNNV